MLHRAIPKGQPAGKAELRANHRPNPNSDPKPDPNPNPNLNPNPVLTLTLTPTLPLPQLHDYATAASLGESRDAVPTLLQLQWLSRAPSRQVLDDGSLRAMQAAGQTLTPTLALALTLAY